MYHRFWTEKDTSDNVSYIFEESLICSFNYLASNDGDLESVYITGHANLLNNVSFFK